MSDTTLPFQELCDTELSTHPEPVRRTAGLFIRACSGLDKYTRSNVPAPAAVTDPVSALNNLAREVLNSLAYLHEDLRQRPGRVARWPALFASIGSSPLVPQLKALLDGNDPWANMFTREASEGLPRTLALELRSLLNRGAALTPTEVSFTTTPCIVRAPSDPRAPEINFGRFKIVLEATKLAQYAATTGDSPEGYFKALALDPHPRTGEHGNPHPHVTESGGMCLGDGRHRVSQLFRAGLIDEACVVIETVLRNYGSSPFRRIETFYTPADVPANCVECGARIRIDDENVSECLDGGHLCPNCGFEDQVRDGQAAGRPFHCEVCDRDTAISQRATVEDGSVMCRHCAQERNLRIVATGNNAPPAPPRPPPVHPCSACGNAAATRTLTDTLLGTTCCEHCSVTHGSYTVSTAVLNGSTPFVMWILMYMQHNLGADRADHFVVDVAASSEATRVDAIRRLTSDEVRSHFRNLANSRGNNAMLTSIVTRANALMGSRIINVTQDACDYHDTLMVERILTPA